MTSKSITLQTKLETRLVLIRSSSRNMMDYVSICHGKPTTPPYMEFMKFQSTQSIYHGMITIHTCQMCHSHHQLCTLESSQQHHKRSQKEAIREKLNLLLKQPWSPSQLDLFAFNYVRSIHTQITHISKRSMRKHMRERVQRRESS